MGDLIEELFIPEKNWQEIMRHVVECLPEEGCGLAGGVTQGRVGRVELVLPVANQLHSPVRFHMDPAGQLRAFQTLEERGLELIAIFHSHPAGPETPSATDLAEFAYPGVLTLILSARLGSSGWQARGFHLVGSQPLYREVLVACGLDKA